MDFPTTASRPVFQPHYPFTFRWRGRAAWLRTRTVALMVFGARASGTRRAP